MKHEVTVRTPTLDVGKADLVFRIRGNDELLGTLRVSHGALDWRPKNKKKAFRVPWERMDDIRPALDQYRRPRD
ncbi:MAG: hypothetical protein IT437_10120 [Phycisphaerales bacterium]|nr:hypothetical protein [Phycisphaerales bacterium]